MTESQPLPDVTFARLSYHPSGPMPPLAWFMSVDGDIFVSCVNNHRSLLVVGDGPGKVKIAADGALSHSVVCDHAECGWQAFGKLEGWK